MYVILRKSNELTSPKKGWGRRPHENDIELADDIERIRYYRNVICHTDALDVKLTNFNESVLDLTGVIFGGFSVAENIFKQTNLLSI